LIIQPSLFKRAWLGILRKSGDNRLNTSLRTGFRKVDYNGYVILSLFADLMTAP
jgi:hypothetical protein